jgi:hypothetical protein
MASLIGLKDRLGRAQVALQYAVRARLLGRRIEAPPIVIAGCGHSGTTLLLSILNAHSHIYGVPYEAKLGLSTPADMRRKVAEFDRWTVAAGKKRWVEKTPANVYHLEKLFALHPQLRVLVTVRDGRDVACSIKARLRAGDSTQEAAFTTGVSRWVDENHAWLRFEGHDRMLTVKYEELVDDFDATMTRILGFAGESFEPGLHRFHEASTAFLHSRGVKPGHEPSPLDHREYRNWQVHQPLFDGRGRWTREMTAPEKAIFKEAAGDLLIRLGYAGNADW